jgi:hypothetical protein
MLLHTNEQIAKYQCSLVAHPALWVRRDHCLQDFKRSGRVALPRQVHRLTDRPLRRLGLAGTIDRDQSEG